MGDAQGVSVAAHLGGGGRPVAGSDPCSCITSRSSTAECACISRICGCSTASEGIRYEVIRAIVLEDSLCLLHGL